MEKENHIRVIRGREFLEYEGLLKKAHAHGLLSLKVELLQVPTSENGMVAICRATASFSREGEVLEFSDLGDASPENVQREISRHLIRMASTRAKGRVLRDALGGKGLVENP